MTGYGSLFERLNGDCDIRAGMSREACAVASVAAHLSKMLSTRAGSVQVAPDYGLPDLNDMSLSLHDARHQACRAIQASIEAYEPRLSHVRVTAVSTYADPLRLSLRIDALLIMEGLKRPVNFSAGLDGSGQLTVSQG
ncbi:type VI secretion system baseplate subunit TssE [Pseudomonas sp. SAICEU22]|uniref:Type VI secretion system baseplate subunit TssE n=1 Tax=Pseudomonas agronomica TaxID=2979328 RepID=A0ABT3F7Q1_9PSED|nr:type VI secretion system baseplate subunit TssE [Pseudomonas agronomica]MCW1245134.1 type VI secretion system baseplate subunit TssE [Pseudomonas agronomica]